MPGGIGDPRRDADMLAFAVPFPGSRMLSQTARWHPRGVLQRRRSLPLLGRDSQHARDTLHRSGGVSREAA